MWWRSELFRTVTSRTATLLQFACFIHLFNEHVIELTNCVGPSMLPTFNMVGDVVALEHFSHRFQRLQIGDVVVAVSPTNPKVAVCKRIIGMSGDIVCVDPSKDPHKYVTVPRGHVWLQGDNMSNSTDSRVYGPVPYALIRGRVFARVYPEMKWIRNNLTPLDESLSK
ncbi:uncharacterized protein VTP21DRAFT_6596 [Calcarisporiella thermophila]|uniref:uncharacterized protein n=1 Tax=Calcarisporiella thermophila TaxID=911321 RepID=UPI00374234C1